MANKQINMSKLRQIIKLHLQSLDTKKFAQRHPSVRPRTPIAKQM
jgi:hypothetical protein